MNRDNKIIGYTLMKDYKPSKNFTAMHLDPGIFPQAFAYKCAKNNKLCSCLLRENEVVLTYITKANVIASPHIFPISEFKGVVAQISALKKKDKSVILSLLHKDLDIFVPLFMSRDLTNALLNWRLWADAYGLPMYLRGKGDKLLLVNKNSSTRTLRLVPAAIPLLLRMALCSVNLRIDGKNVIL